MTSGTYHAFLWTEHRGMVDLGALGGVSNYGHAHGINDAGDVVGVTTPPTFDNAYATIWNGPWQAIAVDFGACGIWTAHQGSVWRQVQSLSPEAMVAGDFDGNGIDDLVVDFGPTLHDPEFGGPLLFIYIPRDPSNRFRPHASST